jgi:hypothetical protein
MTTEGWVEDLARLSAEPGPLVPVIVCWRWTRALRWTSSLLDMVRGTGRDRAELCLLLYAPGSSGRSRPIIEVFVRPDEAINRVHQGTVAEAAGHLEPGAAVLVFVEGHPYLPVYPAVPAGLRSRLGRFLPGSPSS